MNTKLTEDDFQIRSLSSIDHSVADYMVFMNRNPIEMKQQILDNQKIVDGVIALYHSSCQIRDFNLEQLENIERNGLSERFLEEQIEKESITINHMIDMVKFKTGKNIEELS